jgi:polyferredoxin
MLEQVRLKVDEGCRKCGRCEKVCPIDIKVYEKPNSINCIRCLKCAEVCDHISLVKT